METCCAAGSPFKADYTPRGKLERLGGDLEGYVVTGSKPSVAIVLLPDIFGVSEEFPQTKQVSDRLSEVTGYTVCIPDNFRGKAWTMDKFPPKPEDNLMGWIQQVGTYEKLAPDLDTAVSWLKAHDAEKFGIVGCCWGAAIAFSACSQEGGPFLACAGLHPSLFGKTREYAEGLLTPVALVSAKGDPLEEVQEVMDARPALGPKCVWRRFDDMQHGFCAARGDFSNPAICKRVEETVQLLTGFFNANVA